MHDWEFVVTGRIVIRAHCEHDAALAAMDTAREVLSSVDSVELTGISGRVRLVRDNA